MAQVDNPHTPDPGAQAEKERLYAQYGRAMLGFQVVETGLVRLAIPALPEPDEDATVDEAWRVVDRLYSKTMGHVKHKIEKGVEGVPPELLDQLAWGLETRNSLAHDYLRDRLAALRDGGARRSIIAELDGIIERTAALNQLVREFGDHLMREAGTDPAPGREFARQLNDEGVDFQTIRRELPKLAQEFLDSQRKSQ